jgi:hypothetical protein
MPRRQPHDDLGRQRQGLQNQEEDAERAGSHGSTSEERESQILHEWFQVPGRFLESDLHK